MQEFEGSHAVVTGAMSGIGRAVTARLIELGASVTGVDVNAAPIAEWPLFHPVRVDVADVGAVRSALADIAAVDFLVNAAGVLRSAPIEDVTEEEWDFIFGVNAKGLFFLTQTLAPRMTDRRGAIVNVSSIGAVGAVTTSAAAYHASKGAVVTLTKSWSRALAPRGIRVNCVLPGLTATPLLDKIYEDKADATGGDASQLMDSASSGVPLGRLADPAEIADAIVYLLSPRASYITGTSVNVAGGVGIS